MLILAYGRAHVTELIQERLLARIRKTSSIGGRRSSMERVGSAGVLSQWLHEHVKHGGAHPGEVKRSDLLAKSVPLKSRRYKDCLVKRTILTSRWR